MGFRPTHEDEKKKGGHSGLPRTPPLEPIQQACPLFFALQQPITFFNGVLMVLRPTNDDENTLVTPPSIEPSRECQRAVPDAGT
jgi:hypothetical protein